MDGPRQLSPEERVRGKVDVCRTRGRGEAKKPVQTAQTYKHTEYSVLSMGIGVTFCVTLRKQGSVVVG